MVRLPLLLGLFLSFTTGGIVFFLSILAKVTVMTLLFRFLTVFFLFGILGVILGSFLEIVIMPAATSQEKARLNKEMELEDKEIEHELGDLLSSNKSAIGSLKEGEKTTEEFKPAVFPRMTAEGGGVVSRGDSAVVS